MNTNTAIKIAAVLTAGAPLLVQRDPGTIAGALAAILAAFTGPAPTPRR